MVRTCVFTFKKKKIEPIGATSRQNGRCKKKEKVKDDTGVFGLSHGKNSCLRGNGMVLRTQFCTCQVQESMPSRHFEQRPTNFY